MICGYCKNARAEDESPCPHCGTPSPLAGTFQVGGWQPATASRNNHFAGAQPSWGGPMSFEGSPSAFAAPPPAFIPQSPLGPQQGMQMSPREQPQQSMLPVPYQGNPNQNMQMQPFYPQNNSMQMVSAHDISHLLPALPEEDAVYIPPMYTKPRPITPRYRVVSGLISFLVVIMVLCGGAAYYAKASGRLDVVGKFIFGTSTTPQSLQVTPVTIPDPPTQIDRGAAYPIIPSATTTLTVVDNVARQTDVIFKPGQPFYLTYSVQRPPKKGVVTINWYSNGHFYRQAVSTVDAGPNTDINGQASMIYNQPANGSVEIYWDKDLAQRLYFAVRN